MRIDFLKFLDQRGHMIQAETALPSLLMCRRRTQSLRSQSGRNHLAGESLNHRLFKEAMARVQRTRLSLDKYGDCEIEIITPSEIDPPLQLDAPYYADVRLVFTSDSVIFHKWGGEVYIEVHNTNAVHLEKRHNPLRKRAAVIEVDIPDIFTYQVRDEDTNDRREEQHRAFIVRTLEGDHGLLKGRVISDPCSIEYLEAQVFCMQQGQALRQVVQDKIYLGISAALVVIWGLTLYYFFYYLRLHGQG